MTKSFETGRWWMLLQFVIVLFVLALVAAPVALQAAEDVAAGEKLYTKKCATCHGPDGTPKEAIEKMFKVEMKHLGDKTIQAKTAEELQKVVTEGMGKMKPVKDLSATELADVIAYVRTLKVAG